MKGGPWEQGLGTTLNEEYWSARKWKVSYVIVPFLKDGFKELILGVKVKFMKFLFVRFGFIAWLRSYVLFTLTKLGATKF